MQATSNALTNTLNSSHQIPSLTTNNQALGTNQWGYTLTNPDTLSHSSRFNPIPTASTVPTTATILDVAPANPTHSSNTNPNPNPCTSLTNCTTKVLYAANLNPATLPTGTYQTTITYTVTAKPAPKPPVVAPTVCRSGDPKNDCQVDLDANMIPVKYTGDVNHAEWTSLANREDAAHQGEWYNYNQKQWANAVTVKPEALSKYRGQKKVVDQADILGYWVYIPRYAYEVMRRDGTDKPVPAQNFLIQFEKTTTPKRVPAACPEQGKDYRTECYLDRDYIKGQSSTQGTWATHPAFTFGSKELNGIWFAKFETTGSVQQPTVLPNEKRINHYTKGIEDQVKIGAFYEIAKSLGVNDPANTAGMALAGATQNNNNLSRYSSHLVNNTDWGTATYLSASKYGAGYSGVQINGDYVSIGEDTHDEDYYRGSITGCGPAANGSKKQYYGNRVKVPGKKKKKKTIYSPVALGTQSACNVNGIQYAYNGTLGQLASTTNNPTGIYDMSGGGSERVAAAYNENTQQMTEQDYAKLKSDNAPIYSVNTKPPYTNLYNFMGFMHCTWASCGGQALHETHIDGEVNEVHGTHHTADNGRQWLKQVGEFVHIEYIGIEGGEFNYRHTGPWFYRGGATSGSKDSVGLFVTNRYGSSGAFRVVLAPLQD